jgi:hypothetical protein
MLIYHIKQLYILCIALLVVTPVTAQNISGFIIDKHSGERLSGAHVFIKNAPNQATISNEDGFFLLHSDTIDTVIVSHIGYKAEAYSISGQKKNLRIELSPKSYSLSQVTIKGVNTDAIVKKVISTLDENHPEYPVFYNFYHREINFSRDSILHLIAEYNGSVEHKKSSLNKFTNRIKIEQCRLAYFSETGKDMYRNHRSTAVTQIIWDNPLFDRFPHLHKRHSRRIKYRLVGYENVMGRKCFKIRFSSSKPLVYPEGLLYIDAESFAVVKEILTNSNGKETREVNFIKIKDKWFLSSVYHKKSRLGGPSMSVTLYNRIQTPAGQNEYIRIGQLITEYTKDLVDVFSNRKTLNNYQSVPLPDWIKTQIEE